MVVNFNENYHFQGSRGVQHFPGGRGATFSRGGGGSNCLFPIETHITFDFPGGGGVPDHLSPPRIHTWNINSHKRAGRQLKSTPLKDDCPQNQEEHQSLHNNNGVARTLKSYADQRETTGSNSDSLQLRPL